MSFLPSLLTSATPTPSERNFVSRTVFFQTILKSLAVAFSWRGACPEIGKATASIANGTTRNKTDFMARPLRGFCFYDAPDYRRKTMHCNMEKTPPLFV